VKQIAASCSLIQENQNTYVNSMSNQSEIRPSFTTLFGETIGCETVHSKLPTPTKPEDVVFEYIPNPAAADKERTEYARKSKYINANPTRLIMGFVIIGVSYCLTVIKTMLDLP
jgi:hypothetical protein